MDSRKMLYLINATEETGIKEICEINKYNAIKTVSAMQPITKWNQNVWTKNLKQERFRHNADWYMLCGIRQHAVIFTYIHRKKPL